MRSSFSLRAVVTAVLLALAGPTGAESWRGLTVAPEHRCAPYDRDDYLHPQSVERDIIEHMGGRIYGPYTGTQFPNYTPMYNNPEGKSD